MLTGCLGGPVLGPLARGDEALTRRNLDDLLAAVGRDRLFVEVMSHGIAAEDAVLPDLPRSPTSTRFRWSPRTTATTSTPLTPLPRCLAGLRTKKTVDDTKRYRFTGSGYHVKTEAEMRAVRPASGGRTQ